MARRAVLFSPSAQETLILSLQVASSGISQRGRSPRSAPPGADLLKHIEPGTGNRAVDQRFYQRALIHNFATSCIDEKGGRRQPANLAPALGPATA